MSLAHNKSGLFSQKLILFRLALFVATVATVSAVYVATLPAFRPAKVARFGIGSLAAPLAHARHFLAALGPGPCFVCSQQ